MTSDTPLWVFGYGSLMWNPGFEVAETSLARLTGYHRSFCMWSIHHRGTPEHPGLVLALDEAEGGSCDGLGLRVPNDQRDQTLGYLRERELISSAYLEEVLPLTLQDGRQVEAVCFVVDRAHVQYCGDLSLERQAQVIATATGGRGPNTEYLENTAQHMLALGIDDPDMVWLARRVGDL